MTATFMSRRRVLLLPDRHLLAQVGLDLVRHVLEESAGGAAASGTGGHLRRETADAQRLQDLLGNDHFFGAVAVGQRREGSADGIADAFLQQDGRPAVVATMPLEPKPASVSPRCRG